MKNTSELKFQCTKYCEYTHVPGANYDAFLIKCDVLFYKEKTKQQKNIEIHSFIGEGGKTPTNKTKPPTNP